MILALYYQYGTLTLYKVPLKRFSDHFSEYSTVGTVSYLIFQIIPVIYIKKYENSGSEFVIIQRTQKHSDRKIH